VGEPGGLGKVCVCEGSTMILHDKLKENGSKVKAICVAPGLAATDLQVGRTGWAEGRLL
jgi:hypothetical protein